MARCTSHERADDPLETAQAGLPLVSCFWCGQLHPGEHPLSVCPLCSEKFSTTRSLEMNGAFPLSDEVIDAALIRTSPGNYALGYMDGDTFSVFYIGRADSDLRECLHHWVHVPSRYEAYASPLKASWKVRRRRQFPVGAPAPGRVGTAESRYTHFAFSYARSAEDAYAKEWRNYDAFGGRHGLDNEAEPVSR